MKIFKSYKGRAFHKSSIAEKIREWITGERMRGGCYSLEEEEVHFTYIFVGHTAEINLTAASNGDNSAIDRTILTSRPATIIPSIFEMHLKRPIVLRLSLHTQYTPESHCRSGIVCLYCSSPRSMHVNRTETLWVETVRIREPAKLMPIRN